MSNGALKQDEVDQLAPEGIGEEVGRLSEKEHEILASYSNAFREVLGLVIQKFAGTAVEAAWEGTERLRRSDALVRTPGEQVCLSSSLDQGLRGDLLLCLPVADALSITRAMGVEGDELGEMQQDALVETGNLLFAQTHDRIAKKVGVKVSNSPVKSEIATPDGQVLMKHLGNDEEVLLAEFEISGLSESVAKVNLYASPDLLASLERTQEPASGGNPAGSAAFPDTAFPSVRPARFEEFQQRGGGAVPRNLDLLYDVYLTVRVELGRTSMKIQDILEIGNGSVVELDKLAGEPVDLLVNDKLVARGEVVVIDENFGIRVTDIISPQDRIHALR